jgi:hypothetical protein
MAEDTGSAPETPEYGTAPVGPSLAWTDMKRDDVKAFMKIDQVPAPHPAPLPSRARRGLRYTLHLTALLRAAAPAPVVAVTTTQPDAALTFIATKFGLTNYETNAKNAILVDFYLWILMFCKEHGLNEEKTSAAFTIGAADCNAR